MTEARGQETVPPAVPGIRERPADEDRHVGFGLAVLRHYAAADPRLAAAVLEVFEVPCR